MEKESKCTAAFTMKCSSQIADLSCHHYRESKKTPLKCAHRIGNECGNAEARRGAMQAVIGITVSLNGESCRIM